MYLIPNKNPITDRQRPNTGTHVREMGKGDDPSTGMGIILMMDNEYYEYTLDIIILIHIRYQSNKEIRWQGTCIGNSIGVNGLDETTDGGGGAGC